MVFDPCSNNRAIKIHDKMKSDFRIAYLTNHYPAVSHSFIRREIAAIETAGVEVMRWSVRKPTGDLPDARDRAEFVRTQFILDRNLIALFLATIRTLVSHPLRFYRALRTAFAMAQGSPLSLLKHSAYVAEACYLLRRFRVDAVDHIHVHFGTNPTAVARLLYLLGGPPYSFTAHGPDEFDRPEALDLAGKIADAKLAVAISSYGRSQLMRWSNPAHWQKIIIARCGVDDIFLSDTVADQPISTAPDLCCVARLSAQKGLPLLVEAASIVDRRGVDFHLTLVGDGELRSALEAIIEARGLAKKITITGWCDGAAVRNHLLASRAMILPSFAEGLPVVIMEALALSRPVIVSAIAGTPELVDSDCGWLIPAGSVDQLADAMEAALTASPASLQKRGQEGRRRVLQQHNAQVNGTELLRHILAVHGKTL